MAERPAPWPAADPPPPGWLPAPTDAPRPMPAVGFPGAPARPVYREPHPIRVLPLLSGMGATLLWFALFGSLARDLAGYAWWTVAAAVSAWIVAVVLSILGDRGVAVGVAIISGIALSVAGGFVAARWIGTDDWPMW